MTANQNLLVIAHPGHELRVFDWMRRNHPGVFVLTDGSGSRSEGRMDETENLLREVSATRVGWLATFSDKTIYQHILESGAEPFIFRARQLAEYIVANKIRDIAGDMIEGYNPSHDLCRNVINAAVELAGSTGHKVGRNLAFALAGNPGAEANGPKPIEVIQLDESALAAKHAAAMNYSALRPEVELALRTFGKGAFATETFYDAAALGDEPARVPPYYETYGEKQVASGHYTNVIRYRSHVKPLVAAIRKGLGLSASKP